MYSDIHVHTQFSSDSNTPVEAQLERAIKRGMQHLCITDHQDYDYPPWHSVYLLSETGDLDSYLSKLQAVKEAYADRIELLIGIEFGLQPHLAERHNREYAQYPFDYVIGSADGTRRTRPSMMDAPRRRLFGSISRLSWTISPSPTALTPWDTWTSCCGISRGKTGTSPTPGTPASWMSC